MDNFDFSTWEVSGRTGFAGKKRDRQDQERDRLYGPGGWMIAHEVQGKYYSWLEALVQFYEEAYCHYLQTQPELTDWQCREACDVYDNDPSNVNSGLDYNLQESSCNHMQDISIRRALKKIGKKFEGKRLIQVRGRSSEGYAFSPGIVPFHRPEWIKQPELKGWWRKGSIESFWQSNKVLLVKKTN